MLSKAIRLHDAMTDLGRALHDKGELDETIPAYQEATLRAGRFRAEAQYELGLWLREDGERKLNDARRLGFNVVPPPPPATQDAKDQAMPPPPLYFGVGQVERAENYDSAAQAPDPAIDAYAAYQAGNAFRQESALREAVASYRKAVTLQPDMLEVHIELGEDSPRYGPSGRGHRCLPHGHPARSFFPRREATRCDFCRSGSGG